ASHMIMHGLTAQGLDVVRAVRGRYDGARRNPFNDIECGSYYARSMSAWQLVNAWAGFRAYMVDKTMTFAPKTAGDYRLPWSAGGAFGELVSEAGTLSLKVLGGALPAMTLSVGATSHTIPALKAGESAELV